MNRFAALAALSVLGLAACETSTDGRSTFITRERATVLYTAPSEPFTVRFNANYGNADYWCAAGRFATTVTASTSRLYRLTPVPRPQGSSVTFTLVPPATGVQPTGIATFGDNESLSVASAIQQCNFVNTRRFLD